VVHGVSGLATKTRRPPSWPTRRCESAICLYDTICDYKQRPYAAKAYRIQESAMCDPLLWSAPRQRCGPLPSKRKTDGRPRSNNYRNTGAGVLAAGENQDGPSQRERKGEEEGPKPTPHYPSRPPS
jgi:hypothetical protein